jgi:hypothetical protein
MTSFENIVFHYAEWHFKFRPLRMGGWICRKDGGWSFGMLGIVIGRLHKELPIDWKIGPFACRDDLGLRFARIDFTPAWRNYRKEFKP